MIIHDWNKNAKGSPININGRKNKLAIKNDVMKFEPININQQKEHKTFIRKTSNKNHIKKV